MDLLTILLVVIVSWGSNCALQISVGDCLTIIPQENCLKGRKERRREKRREEERKEKQVEMTVSY